MFIPDSRVVYEFKTWCLIFNTALIEQVKKFAQK